MKDSSTDRLTLLKLNELQEHFNVVCLSYVDKVKSNDDHNIWYDFSSKLSVRTGTQFADKALFHKYC